MSYPACEEQRDRRVHEVNRVDAGDTKKIASVVQCHENHGCAAHDIDRFDAERRRCKLIHLIPKLSPAAQPMLISNFRLQSLLTHWYNA
jgi:hypothetical protein